MPYRIELLDEDGAIKETRTALCEHDDAVIDQVGEIPHPNIIEVWQGERHVVRFPPWPRPMV